MFMRTWRRQESSVIMSSVIMSSVITKLSMLEKGLSQDVEDNTDNIQSQDKH